MGTRLNLQTLLETLLGSKNVYFQPPPSFIMQYPCIVYSLNNIKTDHADNRPYNLKKRYAITVIDSNPDSILIDKISVLPACSFERAFTADKLNHTVFNIYY